MAEYGFQYLSVFGSNGHGVIERVSGLAQTSRRNGIGSSMTVIIRRSIGLSRKISNVGNRLLILFALMLALGALSLIHI